MFHFPLKDVKTIEIVSDGYYDQFPNDVSIEAYEALHAQIEKEDPDKYKKYLSTKSKDDRTVLIAWMK